MKKIIAIIFAAAMALSAVSVLADDDDREYTTEGGYFYTAEIGEELENGERRPVRLYYSPDNTSYYYRLKDDGTVDLSARGLFKEEIKFPSTVNGLPVTSVSLSNSMSFLEIVVIPEGVERVYGFGGCEKLKHVSIPSTVKSISFSTFQNDTALETVKLPAGLTVIERGLFRDCASLESIEIPSSVTEIQDNAFSGCTSLEYIKLPAAVEKIGVNAFHDCTALKKVDFNEGLIAIGNYGFTDCPIETLKLPSTLVKIGGGAFLRNKSLKSVVIPQNVRAIEFSSFSGTSLESVVFESDPEQIGIQAFYDTPLKEVTGLSKKSITKFWPAFKKTPWQEKMKDDAEPFLVDEDGRLVAYIGSSTDAVIPETVKIVGGTSFDNSITSVTIPNTVTQIEDNAFYGCDKLTAITIPASVNKIGQMAFSHCYRLKDITFEYSSATLSLGSSAFQFTLASPETLVTNNRRYTNQKTAFQNTYFDVDYVPIGKSEVSYGEYNTDATASPESTAAPTAAPESTNKPAETSAPTEQPGTIDVISGDTITVEVNNRTVTFPDAEPFIDENGRTQIPIRAVAETLSCKVDWDGETQTATVTKGDAVITIGIGKNIIQSGRDIITMDTAADIIDGRTYIPLRFVGEALGITVNWTEGEKQNE